MLPVAARGRPKDRSGLAGRCRRARGVGCRPPTPRTGTGRWWPVRRTVSFLLAVVVAIVTPTPDAITMFMLWLPAVALFEVGYFVYCRSG